LYRLLYRLKKDRVIASTWSDSQAGSLKEFRDEMNRFYAETMHP
jgi:hypothetical protein